MDPASIRLYAELNDHLPPSDRQVWLRRELADGARVSDLLRALGVPPSEVDLVLVDGHSASLADPVPGGARVSVYPVFERFDVGSVARVRGHPLRAPRFAIDSGLARLGLALRALGFETFAFPSDESMHPSGGSTPILLTLDPALPARLGASHAVVLRERRAARQAREVIGALQLQRLAERQKRCLRCGAVLIALRCGGCGRFARGRGAGP
jgi:hypothetical protein